MNQPRTSIIIPSYQGEAKLPTLLNALSQQSDTDFEAVVVIDGLLDNSLEIIDSFASKVPVRAVVLEQNQGRVAALNAGLAPLKARFWCAATTILNLVQTLSLGTGRATKASPAASSG